MGSALPPPTRSSSPSAGRGSEDRDLGGRLGKVVQELAATPVEEGSHIGSTLNEALHDQEFVERAARWRGGNYGRQVASVLAKVAKYLKMIRPEILEDASSRLAFNLFGHYLWYRWAQMPAYLPDCLRNGKPGIQAGEFLFPGLFGCAWPSCYCSTLDL